MRGVGAVCGVLKMCDRVWELCEGCGSCARDVGAV